MAVGYVIEIPGGSKEQYEQLFAKVMGVPVGQGTPKPGGLVHIAGPIPGGWRIIDVWESRDAMMRFLSEDIGPAAQALGFPQAQPQFFDVGNFMK